MEEKEGGYSLCFKSRTRRTGLPRPRDASLVFFSTPFFPRAYPFFFFFPSRLPPPRAPPLPLGRPMTASLFISRPLGFSQVSEEARAAQKSRLQRAGPVSRPSRIVVSRGIGADSPVSRAIRRETRGGIRSRSKKNAGETRFPSGYLSEYNHGDLYSPQPSAC